MSVIKGTYPPSKNGNFSIIDTIGIPHPYMIGTAHMKYVSMVIDGGAIRHAEQNGASCYICKRLFKQGEIDHILTFDEHKQSLLVGCKADPNTNPEVKRELQDWLLSIKDESTKNNYEGFAFTQVSPKPYEA